MKSLILILSLALMGCGLGHGIEYSQGSRVGVVVKFSQKGIICKTWEGTMNLGAASNNRDGMMVPTTWDFTVESAEQVEKVNRAMESGKSVKLYYRQGWFTGPCTTDSGYFVGAVEELK